MAKKKALQNKDHEALEAPQTPQEVQSPAIEEHVEAVADEEAGSEDNLPQAEPESGFPIVGIGASAGGLAAFEQFFAAVPAATESGMAFVLVQHLDPDYKSILTELVKRHTQMRVFEVGNGMEVQPNKDLHLAAQPDRPRLFSLQAEHHRATHGCQLS
jgi:two-component system CheB/CheR fusion protein